MKIRTTTWLLALLSSACAVSTDATDDPLVVSSAHACTDVSAIGDVKGESVAPNGMGLATGTKVAIVVGDARGVIASSSGAVTATAANWEKATTFTIHVRPGGRVALASPSGYLTAHGGGGGAVTARACSAGPNETFTIVHLDDGKIALRTANDHYIRAEDGGGGEVNALGERAGSWTRISLVPLSRTVSSTQFGIAGAYWPTGAVDMGAKWIRTDVRWDSSQPKEGGPFVFDGTKDKYVTEAISGGARVLGNLSYAPLWAMDAQCAKDLVGDDAQNFCKPRDPKEYGAYAVAMVHHFKTLGVHHWEIWNEANSHAFFRPEPDVALYSKMLIDSYDAMRTEDPDAVIVAGGTASLGVYNQDGDSGSHAIDSRKFLLGIYANGAGDAFDAYSHHPYGFAERTPFEQTNGWEILATDLPVSKQNPHGVPSLLTILRNHNDGGKAIWNSEFGMPTGTFTNIGTFTQAEQSSLMKATFTVWEKYAWAGPSFWYTWADHSPPTSSVVDVKQHGNYLGITKDVAGDPGCDSKGNPTGSAKLAYCTFRAWMN